MYSRILKERICDREIYFSLNKNDKKVISGINYNTCECWASEQEWTELYLGSGWEVPFDARAGVVLIVCAEPGKV